MAIGNADFTAKQQRGMGWKFGVGNTWDEIQPLLLAWLQEQAVQWNRERAASTAAFNEGIDQIVLNLKDNPEKLAEVKTLLGL